jgi:hypothetical protein
MALTTEAVDGVGYFKDGTSTVTLIGVNDPIVFPLGMFDPNQKYKNQEFWGNYSYDPTTSMTADSDEQFWWKFFWLLKNKYSMNLLRAGAHDTWATGVMHRKWKSDSVGFYSTIDLCLKGAAWNGCYFLPELSGFAEPWGGLHTFDIDTGAFEPAASLSNPMAGHLMSKGSACYNHFTDYVAAIMGHVKGKVGLCGVEISNEPDHDQMANNLWGSTTYFSDVTAAGRLTNYTSWTTDIFSAITGKNHDCLLSMGHALEGGMFDEDWATGNWCKNPNAPLDFSQYHKYFSMSGGLDDPTNQSKGYWYYKTVADYLKSLGKPFMMSEWGYANAVDGAYNTYRAEYDSYCDAAAFSGQAAMRLQGHPTFPLSSQATTIPVMPTTDPDAGGEDPENPETPSTTINGVTLQLNPLTNRWEIVTNDGTTVLGDSPWIMMVLKK